MSGLADEMSRRMAADGVDLSGNGTDAVPGTDGGTQSTPTPPAAGPSNTDMGQNGPPDTIPYTRFKEVNDQLQELKGFDTLRQYGYDPDSLGRLAAFEQAYLRDPIGTFKTMADNLDLPPAVKEAIERELGESAAAGTAQGEPSATSPASLELPPEVVKKLEYVDQLQAREADAFQQAQLDRVLSHWNALDKQDGLETPDDVKLMAISAAGGSNQVFDTVEALAEAARRPIVGYRSSVLGSAVQRTGTGSPLAVPGSASAPSGPVEFKTLRDASRAAEEAIKRGELPGTA